jgi:transposase
VSGVANDVSAEARGTVWPSRCTSMMGSGRCWSRCCRNACLGGSGVLVLMTASCSRPSCSVLVTGVPWRVLPRQLAARASQRGGGCATGRRPACGIACTASCSGGSTPSAARVVGRGGVGGSHIRAFRGGPLTGRSPVDRGRTGSKHHLIVDCHGVPLAATLTGNHRNHITRLLPLVDGIGAIAGKRGRPRRRPDRLIADRGCDHDKYRRELWRRGVKPVIARRCTEHGSGLGRVRWVVERTFAWLHNFRRLRIRWERNAGLHYAFLSLGCSLICWRHTRP